jgi:hypothetical protein
MWHWTMGFPLRTDRARARARQAALGGVLVCALLALGSPAESAAAGCTVDAATMTAPGCAVLRSDDGGGAPEATWGSVDCETAGRASLVTGGGDPSATPSGAAQGNDSYRRLTVLDGDDVWGERCELGHNDWQSARGTFSLYQEGDHKITFFSQRYSSESFASVDQWQTVFQAKQAQPYAGDGNAGVALELQIMNDKLYLQRWWETDWTTPAPVAGAWIRYALDVVYSADPNRGSVQLYVDGNGDGDWLDEGEQSPLVRGATLATETDGGAGLAVGASIPSHARIGLYHDESIPCPPPSGCGLDSDNVAVVNAGPTGTGVGAGARFHIERVKRHNNATATMVVRAPGPGTIAIGGRGVRTRGAGQSKASNRATSGGRVKVLIKSRGQAKRKLRRSGRARVLAKVTYRPTGGSPDRRGKPIKLVRR